MRVRRGCVVMGLVAGLVMVAPVQAGASSQRRAAALLEIAGLRDAVQSYRSAHAIKLASVSIQLLSDLQSAQNAVKAGGTAPSVFTQFIADVQAQRGGAIYAGGADLTVREANGTVPVKVVQVSPTAASSVSTSVGTERLRVGLPAASSIGSVVIGGQDRPSP